jgi:C4-dicarboxylate transporter
MGMGFTAPNHSWWYAMMEAVENIALIIALMVAGVGFTVAMLCGFVYYLEVQND